MTSQQKTPTPAAIEHAAALVFDQLPTCKRVLSMKAASVASLNEAEARLLWHRLQRAESEAAAAMVTAFALIDVYDDTSDTAAAVLFGQLLSRHADTVRKHCTALQDALKAQFRRQ